MTEPPPQDPREALEARARAFFREQYARYEERHAPMTLIAAIIPGVLKQIEQQHREGKR